VTPGVELEAAIAEAAPYNGAFQAAVTRRVHAAALAHRALFIGEVGGRLQRLRAEHAQVMALKTTADSQDQTLQHLVERAAARSGTVLPVPAIVWPSGKNSDPFDGPVLKP
jgi:aminoglycoside phosphotransferase